jgi:hypothetical protein
MMIEGSGSRAGSIPLNSESGSESPKNMWIRIRIRNTASKEQIWQRYQAKIRPVKKTREILLFHSTEAYSVDVPGQALADFQLGAFSCSFSQGIK